MISHYSKGIESSGVGRTGFCPQRLQQPKHLLTITFLFLRTRHILFRTMCVSAGSLPLPDTFNWQDSVTRPCLLSRKAENVGGVHPSSYPSSTYPIHPSIHSKYLIHSIHPSIPCMHSSILYTQSTHPIHLFRHTGMHPSFYSFHSSSHSSIHTFIHSIHPHIYPSPPSYPSYTIHPIYACMHASIQSIYSCTHTSTLSMHPIHSSMHPTHPCMHPSTFASNHSIHSACTPYPFIQIAMRSAIC